MPWRASSGGLRALGFSLPRGAFWSWSAFLVLRGGFARVWRSPSQRPRPPWSRIRRPGRRARSACACRCAPPPPLTEQKAPPHQRRAETCGRSPSGAGLRPRRRSVPLRRRGLVDVERPLRCGPARKNPPNRGSGSTGVPGYQRSERFLRTYVRGVRATIARSANQRSGFRLRVRGSDARGCGGAGRRAW
jgi:hypothetical protein